MSQVLGRTRSVGLGKEGPYGVAVAPTVWLPQQDVSIEDKIARIFDNSGLGTRNGSFGGDTSMTCATGNINGLVYDRSFGHIATAVRGVVTTAAHPTATGVNVHTISAGNTLPSYTIATKDDNESKRAAGAMLDKLTIKADQGYVTFTSSWMAIKGATATNTPSFTAENRFRPQDVVIKIAPTLAGLAAATALRVKNLTFSLDNSLITEPSLGTTDPAYYPGTIKTSLSMGRLYLDTTIKDLVFGTTQQALSIAFTRSDTLIGTGTPTNPSIVLTFQPGFFAEWSRDGGLDALKQEKFSYTPIFSTTTASEFGLVMTNTEAGY